MQLSVNQGDQDILPSPSPVVLLQGLDALTSDEVVRTPVERTPGSDGTAYHGATRPNSHAMHMSRAAIAIRDLSVVRAVSRSSLTICRS